jgi:hypothetical protein
MDGELAWLVCCIVSLCHVRIECSCACCWRVGIRLIQFKLLFQTNISRWFGNKVVNCDQKRTFVYSERLDK